MSTPDSVYGVCPACQGHFSSQTKLGQCLCANIHVGNTFESPDMLFELKTPCSCGQYLTAVIKNRRLLELRIGDAELREGAWGETVPASVSREELSALQADDFNTLVAWTKNS